VKTFTALDAGMEILRAAQQFLDMHEVEPNTAWCRPADSDHLRKLLAQTGWQPTWPYCAAFVEACWGVACHVLAPEAEDALRSRFTVSVMRTYANVKERVHRSRPAPGAVFFMQKGTSGLGHAGLVLLAGERVMATIEGNTSPGVVGEARDREGDGVYLKLRPITFGPSATALHLLGFLDPPGAEELQALLAAGLT
jgi:hypothetical protein